MRILILGAGQVGGTLAKNLVNEDNDITLIDINENRLLELQHRLDIQTVVGNAAHPDVLIEAGIQKADMLIAVTNSDEVNMMGCFIAHALFHTPNKIARIRSENYYKYPTLFSNQHIPIDVCISPETLVTEHLINLIHYPGTTQVIDFADDLVLMMTVRVEKKSVLAHKTVQQVQQFLKNIPARPVALFRNKHAMQLSDDFMIHLYDEVVFITSSKEANDLLILLGQKTTPNQRIMIAGGGNIGCRLAERLENQYHIKIIDHNPRTAAALASTLHKSMVLEGDIADKNLLLNENIEFTDVFCAVTDDDEDNIMSCLQAKQLGARYAMALVNRDTYVDLIDESSIDYAISPQLITIGSILTKIRRGNMIKVQRLQHDEIEAMELILYGNQQTSHVIGRCMRDIPLPPGCSIAAVVREDTIYINDDTLILAEKDHVILLSLKKRYIHQIEALFQVNLTFLN